MLRDRERIAKMNVAGKIQEYCSFSTVRHQNLIQLKAMSVWVLKINIIQLFK